MPRAIEAVRSLNGYSVTIYNANPANTAETF